MLEFTAPAAATICAGCGEPADLLWGTGGTREYVCRECAFRELGFDVAALVGACLDAFSPPGTCPECGTTTELALRSGLLGCPLCYVALNPKA